MIFIKSRPDPDPDPKEIFTDPRHTALNIEFEASYLVETLTKFQPAKSSKGSSHQDQRLVTNVGYESSEKSHRVVRDGGYGHQECHSTFIVFPFLGKFYCK
jgi:hypothetical protein